MYLDQQLVEENVKANYAGFWPRVGASVIDFLILAPVTIGVTYFNIVSMKSLAVLLLINLAALAYKPFMEFAYGATFGKKSLDLRVVNVDLQPANLKEVLLRNIFHIGGTLVSILFSIQMFFAPGFEEVDGFTSYITFTQAAGASAATMVNYLLMLITLVDVIVLLVDDKNRSLHDKIGNTCVIGR
jgi:uncharacterized RDD family membrane protein YckC